MPRIIFCNGKFDRSDLGSIGIGNSKRMIVHFNGRNVRCFDRSFFGSKRYSKVKEGISLFYYQGDILKM